MDKLKVIVKADYSEIAESDNPLLCAQIIALIAADQQQNPKTAEQIAMEKFEERAEQAESAKSSAEYWKKEADKKVEALTKEIEDLKAKVGEVVGE